MRTEPRVAVGIPVHNGERFLAEALHSVLVQTHPPSDVVVVDDGSDDATADIARRFGPPVRVVRRRRRGGAGAARSLALELARGEMLLPLDADDLLTPHSIEARLRVLCTQPEIDVVYGHARSFARYDGAAPIPLDEPHPAHVPDAMLIRRTAYKRVGPFAAELRVAECLDWLLRAREIGLREATVPEQVLWRRIHGANNSLTGRAAMHEFPRTIKASLDRRRAASS